MKFDQETVIKHQFWFLLGGYLLVWLVAVLWLWGVAGGLIADAEKAYTGASKSVQTAQGSAVNVSLYLPPWKEEFDTINKHKVKIWETAWDWQAGMYDWPKEWLEKYNGMTDPHVDIQTDDKNNYKDKLYPDQISSLRKYAPLWIDPVEFLNGFDSVFKPMTSNDWKDNPTREECWLAQEDMWVKRELFYIIYDALARQAIMQPKQIDEQKEPQPQGVEGRYRFANQNWEITLHIRKNGEGLFVIGGDSTIKNTHPSHQPQPLTSAKGGGIWFNISQDRVRTPFEVKGEPVKWGDKQAFSAVDYQRINGIEWDKDKLKDKPILVSQGFDQTNSPIRRLNAIELRKQDCRTFVWALQPNHTLEQLDASTEAADPSKKATGGLGTTQTGPGGGGGGPDMAAQMQRAQQQQKKQLSMGGMMPGMRGSQASAAKNPTPNNEIERDRYLQPSSQDKKANPPSRHLPLAFQLIVEQSHMHDVLLSLANSRLRFQTTQVDFRHVKDYKPQSDSDKKDGDAAGSGQRLFGGVMPGQMSGGYGSYGSGGAMQQRQGQMMDRQNQMQQQQMQQMQQMQQRRQQMQMGNSNPMMMNPYRQQNAGINAPSARGGNRTTSSSTAAKTPEAENPPDDNLVEMTVYGIATLYRIPDAPQQTAQPGSPATSTQQTGQQQSPVAASPTPAPTQPNKEANQPKAPPADKQSDNDNKQQKGPPPTGKQPDKKSNPPTTPPKTGDKR